MLTLSEEKMPATRASLAGDLARLAVTPVTGAPIVHASLSKMMAQRELVDLAIAWLEARLGPKDD